MQSLHHGFSLARLLRARCVSVGLFRCALGIATGADLLTLVKARGVHLVGSVLQSQQHTSRSRRRPGSWCDGAQLVVLALRHAASALRQDEAFWDLTRVHPADDELAQIRARRMAELRSQNPQLADSASGGGSGAGGGMPSQKQHQEQQQK